MLQKVNERIMLGSPRVVNNLDDIDKVPTHATHDFILAKVGQTFMLLFVQ